MGSAGAAAQARGFSCLIDSAGTASYHIGSQPDPRAIAVASNRGIDIAGPAARQIDRDDFFRFTHIIAMDRANLESLRARTPRDVCGEEMLRALPGFGERIRFIPVVSLPGEDGQWSGATGYVHDQLEQVLPARMAEYEFYFAGPPPMTQAIQELLMIGHQVPFAQIHFDRFF